MLGYYLHTAWLNLRRSPWLTALIVALLGMGIGSSMTVYSLLRAMLRDPIPQKSSQLYAPRLDTLGPRHQQWHLAGGEGQPDFYMTYKDAVAGRNAAWDMGAPAAVMHWRKHLLRRQESDARPLSVNVRATDVDFFHMFDVKSWADGGAWTREDNERGARVVVLSEETALRLFQRTDVVGESVLLADRLFRIVGVMKHWRPQPLFYDFGSLLWTKFALRDDIFVPLDAATALMETGPSMGGSLICPPDRDGVLPFLGNIGEGMASECLWTQLWVELPTDAQRQRFSARWEDYVAEQQRSGRFDWRPTPWLGNVTDTLVAYKVIPDEYRIATLLAFSFLIVCLINAVGLMLARFRQRTAELVLCRALGASRRSLFAQCLTETALIGLLGGMGGLALMGVGFWVQGWTMPGALGLATRDVYTVLLAAGLAVAGAVLAGLYPAWRAAFADSVAGHGNGRRGRAGAVLMAMQLALTLALLSNALFIAWQQLQVILPAGEREQDLIVTTSIWPRGYEDLPARRERDLAELRSISGVDAATTAVIPGTVGASPISDCAGREIGAERYVVDDHTPEVWRTRQIRGEWFGPQDVGMLRPETVPAEVGVNRALAEYFWPGGAVGQSICFPPMRDATGTVTRLRAKVRVVIDGVPGPRPDYSRYVVFLPGFFFWEGTSGTYQVRVSPGRRDVVRLEVDRRLRAIDPERSLEHGLVLTPPPVTAGTLLPTFSEIRRQVEIPSWDQFVTLVSTCILLLIVNALGIVGLAWYWIAQRRAHIGIRRALGAQRRDILLRFQSENLLMVGVGVLVGAVLTAAGNAWLMERFQMPRIPLIAVAGGALLIAVVSQLAVLWPALRAARIPPAVVTRTA